MNRLQLIQRVRSHTRDFTNAVFKDADVVDYLNEGIQRVRQSAIELRGMEPLLASDESPVLLPDMYHHLLSIYSSARCFAQDDRHYQAGTLMNEFETKLNELKQDIDSGIVVIVDPLTGMPVQNGKVPEYITQAYYSKHNHRDLDTGVEGVGY